MKAEDTFSTSSKTHHTTTKDRQIDFMWHLYGQGFTQKEIAAVYNVTTGRIESAFRNKRTKLEK